MAAKRSKSSNAKSSSTSTSRSKPARAAYHHGDLRRAILDEALTVIARQGPAAVSLRELAVRTGVSHAAPYRHFKTKEALLATVAEEGFRMLANAELAALDIAGSDARARLRGIGVAYVLFAVDHPGHFKVMFGAVGDAPAEVPGVLVEGAAAFKVLLDTVIEAQRAGVLRAGDPLPLAIAAWSSVHGLASLWIEQVFARMPLTWPGFDAGHAPAQLARHLVDILIAGAAS